MGDDARRSSEAARSRALAASRALGLAAVLLAAACGTSHAPRGTERTERTERTEPTSATGATGTPEAGPPKIADKPDGTTKGPTQMADTEADTAADLAIVKDAIAKEIKVSPGDVKVREVPVSVPGITVFKASVNPAKAGRAVTRTGIVEGGAIYTETEAMSRVVRAWGYGAKRTVPPDQVAQAFGALHNATADSSAMIDDDTVQTYKKVSGPKRAAAATVPVETTAGGHPAVVYCLTSSSRGTPFSVVTAIVKPGGKVEIRAQPVLED